MNRTPEEHAEDVLLELRDWFEHWFGPDGGVGFSRYVYEPLYLEEPDPDVLAAEAGKYNTSYGPGNPFSPDGVREVLEKFGLPCMPQHWQRPYFGELLAGAAAASMAMLCFDRNEERSAWNYCIEAAAWAEQIARGEIHAAVRRELPAVSGKTLNAIFSKRGAVARHAETNKWKEVIRNDWKLHGHEYDSKAQFARVMARRLSQEHGVAVTEKTIRESWLKSLAPPAGKR